MSQTITTQRPQTSEFGAYFKPYIDRVPERDVLLVLEEQLAETTELFGALGSGAQGFAYAPGKWTVNQLLGHVLDAEWIFSSRCLWFARGNAGPLPGMDQDQFVNGADFDKRSLASLQVEFGHLRRAGLTLFQSFDEVVLDRAGEASGSHLSVRALIFLLAGHTAHHLDVLRERYQPLLVSK